jgi:hypothetical protein
LQPGAEHRFFGLPQLSFFGALDVEGERTMNASIFRKKSLDRISSPEAIDDYIKIMRPGMWLVLAAILLVLAAAVIWSITGRIETTLTAQGRVAGQQVTLELTQDQMSGVAVGSEVRVGEAVGEVLAVTQDAQDAGRFQVVASAPGAADGVACVTLVTERIAPITFLTE